MTILRDTFTDLRDKRLWPIAAALLVALVAIPVLLTTSSSTPSAPPAPVGPLAQAGPTLPAVSVSNVTPSHVKLTGKSRDPFTQRHVRPTTTTTTAGTTTSSPQSKGGGTGAKTTSPATTTTPATSTTPTTPAASIPTAKAPAGPPALTASQSYNVAFSMTNTSGGLDTVNSLERLSVLPSKRIPLLVELGVLRGGHRVLFALQPHAVVHGPGRCTPGPIDCQVLSLAQGQVESLAARANGWTSPAALFAVTAITAQNHGSASAADKLRQRVSGAGRHLLAGSALSALSLFKYVPSLGAIVDLRNLAVGGN